MSKLFSALLCIILLSISNKASSSDGFGFNQYDKNTAARILATMESPDPYVLPLDTDCNSNVSTEEVDIEKRPISQVSGGSNAFQPTLKKAKTSANKFEDVSTSNLNGDDNQSKARILYNNALKLYNQKNYQKAVQELKSGIELCGELTPVDFYCLLGRVSYDSGSYEEAEASLRKYIKILSDYNNVPEANIYGVLALTQVKLKNYHEALKNFRSYNKSGGMITTHASYFALGKTQM
ncbi:MAG: tetratricopeptide repeat protein, partial [Alphaproteobacteria bacterium]